AHRGDRFWKKALRCAKFTVAKTLTRLPSAATLSRRERDIGDATIRGQGGGGRSRRPWRSGRRVGGGRVRRGRAIQGPRRASRSGLGIARRRGSQWLRRRRGQPWLEWNRGVCGPRALAWEHRGRQ